MLLTKRLCSLVVCPSGCFHLNIWHSFKIFKSYFPLDFTKGNYWFLLLFFKNYFLAKDHLIWFVYVRPYELLTSRGIYDCDSYKDTQIYIQNSLDFVPKSIENIRLIPAKKRISYVIRKPYDKIKSMLVYVFC